MAHAQPYLINGSFDDVISPLDRGFAYGDGVFRTFIMRDGQPEHWPLHYQKLVADCAAINIVCPSADLLMSDLQQLFFPDELAVAKIIVTRGNGSRGYAPPAITAPTRVVTKSAIPQHVEKRLSEGVNLTVCTTRLASQGKLAGIKHLNRLENVLARMEWSSPEIADGIMLDMQDHVIECTAANIFARFGDALITPSLHLCGIAGITRQRIMNVAHTLSLKVSEETFGLKKLLSADEVIICNSLYGAWQVHKVEDKTLKVGSLAANICEALK